LRVRTRAKARPKRQTLEAAPIFAALGDPVRLAMVAQLCGDGPLATIQLKQGTTLTRQAVTKHLRTLEQAGLVTSDLVGRDRLWTLEARRLAEIRRYLERISAQWDERLARLQTLVEGVARLGEET